MDDSFDQFPRWAAPAEDGGTLIWPSPDRLIAEARQNNLALRGAGARIQNVPLHEARRVMRRCLGHSDDERLFIATGHQAELYHVGVWAKDVVIDLAARAGGGTAYHIAVETDEPKHLDLRWPGESHPISDDAGLRAARWSGLVKPPSAAHLTNLRNRLAAAREGWSFEPLLGFFLDEMQKAAGVANPRPSLARAVTDACHALDESLGLRTRTVLAGPVWCCPAYLLFAHHILARAGVFAATYNEALAAFRRANGIKNPGRPMPDLKTGPDVIEAPFWIDELRHGGRTRGSVRRMPDGLALDAGGGEVFRLDPDTDGWMAAQRLGDFLRRHDLRLSPRALTLTMCLRLLAADQFVHGIGGGLYDQVSDRIIVRHFDVPRPRFAVATATLLFPEAAGRQRACLRCLRQEGRRLRHGILGEAKMGLVRGIVAAPRHSARRRELFAELHRRLRDGQSDPRLEHWRRTYAMAREQDARDDRIFDRELFYAVQPRQRLQNLIGVYADGFARAEASRCTMPP